MDALPPTQSFMEVSMKQAKKQSIILLKVILPLPSNVIVILILTLLHYGRSLHRFCKGLVSFLKA
jgi:hypothetical protein